MINLKLELELIPEKQWGKSLAHLLSKPVWDTLRREVYKRDGYQCTICGATDTRVNCHEVWEYQDRGKKHIQHLKEFRTLCDQCHDIKHWGRTVSLVHQGKLLTSYLEELTKHFCEVNNCSIEDFNNHKVVAGERWLKRSRYEYKINWGKLAPDKVTKIWIERNKI